MQQSRKFPLQRSVWNPIRSRAAVSHEPRGEVKVVVVEEDRRLGHGFQLGEHSLGEPFVDRHVPVPPCSRESRVERGGERHVEQVVLQEPQRRVGDHVVEAIECLRVVLHESQSIGRPVTRRLLHGPASGLGGNNPVLVAHRTRDPGHVVVYDETAQRRNQPASPAAGAPAAVLVT